MYLSKRLNNNYETVNWTNLIDRQIAKTKAKQHAKIPKCIRIRQKKNQMLGRKKGKKIKNINSYIYVYKYVHILHDIV